jgi:hypothetical protein
MNYLEAANIRSKGFAQLMTEKLLAGQGVFSSIRSTRADRSMSQKIARKEKYDILNIARFLTGGNKLATALVGKMAGRNTEDIRYFVGKGKNKTYTPERPTNYWNRVMGGSGESIEATPVLRQILEILPANSLQEGFIAYTTKYPDDDAYRMQFLFDLIDLLHK